MKLLRLFIVLFLMWGSSLSAVAQTPDDLPTCPAPAAEICQIDEEWSLDQVQAEVGDLEPRYGGFFAHDQMLTFVYHSPNEGLSATVSAVIMSEVPMQRIEGTGWWTLTVKFEGIDEAVVSFGIADRGATGYFAMPVATWYGANAPQRQPVNDPLQGSIDMIPFESEALGETRSVYVYLPPAYDPEQTYPVIYMADGSLLSEYVGGIDYLITEGDVLPLIIVGIDSASNTPERNFRGEEYVPGRNAERFEQHERFFTEEVRLWAESSYGASTKREERAVFGVSNGGLFAVAMSIRHPDLYGVIFPFSAGAGAGFEPFEITRDSLQLPLYVYSTAGTLEPTFLTTTQEFIQEYTEAGAEVVFVPRVSGHNDTNWQIEFVNAARWAFADTAAQ